MRFTRRSLGGKLTVSAALVLLLCMLFYIITTWGLFTFYANRETRNNAQIQLSLAKQAYTAHNTVLIQALQTIASDQTIVSSITAQGRIMQSRLQEISLPIRNRFSLSSIEIVSPNHNILAHGEDDKGNDTLSVLAVPLIDQAAVMGKIATSLQTEMLSVSPTQQSSWVLRVALPILQGNHKAPVGVLLAAQPINDTFAQAIVDHTNTNILLCISGKYRASRKRL